MRLLYFLAYATGLAAAPSITAVYNAASWLPTSLPNSGVAQGAYFTVTGSGMGPASLVVAPSYPLQTTQGLGGTVVNVTVGSVSLPCVMYYTSSTQVSAILPSATPVGNGTLTVSYQGSNASVAIQVVAGSFGIFTLNSAGSGPASITDLSYTPITMIHAAHSGDTLVIWGTGLGAVSGDETEPPSPSNFSGVEVLIGNELVTPSYAGRSSFPGLDQINFTVPAGISGGCQTSIGVVVKGVTGNVVTTSIAPVGQTTCGDTLGALTTKNLQKAITNGALNIAAVDLSRVGSDADGFVGVFATYPLNSLIRSYAGTFSPSPGSCVVYEVSAGSPLILSDPIVSTLPHLDAGPSLTVSSLNGASITVDATFTGVFEKAVGTSSSQYISPGEFGVSNGNGGSQVGPFDWGDTMYSSLDFVGLPATLNRASDLTVKWTTSLSYAMVNILGYSAVPNGPQDSWVNFVCAAPASSTQFTIPSAVLSMLPTNGYGATGALGVLMEVAGLVDNRFTIAGTPGIDAGMFTMFASTGAVVKVQ